MYYYIRYSLNAIINYRIILGHERVIDTSGNFYAPKD
jgi:hypothetical protein